MINLISWPHRAFILAVFVIATGGFYLESVTTFVSTLMSGLIIVFIAGPKKTEVSWSSLVWINILLTVMLSGGGLVKDDGPDSRTFPTLSFLVAAIIIYQIILVTIKIFRNRVWQKPIR